MNQNGMKTIGGRNIFIFLLLLTCFVFFPALTFSQVQVGGENLDLDYAHPKDYIVGGIVITGPKFLDETVLKNLSGLSVGDTVTIPGEKIVKAMDNLWKQGLFSDIKIVAQKVIGDQIF